MKTVEITESNYQDYQRIDVVAFSFAFSGAMGEGGGIYIVDREGQIYHANYCDDEIYIEPSHIKDIIPFIDDIQFGIFGNMSTNEDWDTIYLGYGNHLVFAKEYSDDLRKKVEDAKYRYPGELFQHWPGIILGFLGKEGCHLTMSDIWKLIDA